MTIALGAHPDLHLGAEHLMRQVDAEKLIENGLMPLLSMKGQDWIRLAGFRAINGSPFID